MWCDLHSLTHSAVVADPLLDLVAPSHWLTYNIIACGSGHFRGKIKRRNSNSKVTSTRLKLRFHCLSPRLLGSAIFFFFLISKFFKLVENFWHCFVNAWAMQALYMLGDIAAGPAFRFTQWLQLVRKRTSKYPSSGFPRRPSTSTAMPSTSLLVTYCSHFPLLSLFP